MYTCNNNRMIDYRISNYRIYRLATTHYRTHKHFQTLPEIHAEWYENCNFGYFCVLLSNNSVLEVYSEKNPITILIPITLNRWILNYDLIRIIKVYIQFNEKLTHFSNFERTFLQMIAENYKFPHKYGTFIHS